MRRSEALLQILQTMHRTIDGDNGIYVSDAEAVLECLENLGMEPPFSSELYYKTWRNGGTGREWEEE